MRREITLTAYLSSRQLVLFAFTRQYSEPQDLPDLDQPLRTQVMSDCHLWNQWGDVSWLQA